MPCASARAGNVARNSGVPACLAMNAISARERNNFVRLDMEARRAPCVRMLTRVLAKELGHDRIRVNAIAPGVIKTKFSQALWDNPDILEHTVSTAALGRIGMPDEIVGAALYLASDASSFMTGQTLVLDGAVS